MCGICGFTGPPDSAVLKQMTSTLYHRGPDEAGVWQGENVALGMRRLAIIDLESGQQPVFNEDRTIAAVFNGEIYNHIELRETLEAQGHHFRTHHSDSEVIVHLYENYGLDFPKYLNGMFAIALWDKKEQRLILVRDHCGIKPLYIAPLQGEMLFASEPKAILAHPTFSRQPNWQAIHHYFSFKNIPAPFSAYKGMQQLHPGELIAWHKGELKRQFWWNPSWEVDPHMDEVDARNEVRRLLEKSVKLQMRADVPVAAYLSGGVDSSSVVALMSRLTDQPIKTFTLVYETREGFDNKEADRKNAQAVSQMYQTEHIEHLVTYGDIPKTLENILSSFDEPFSGVISTYFISQSIAQHVKVALSGDGADELFGSYLSHRQAQPLAFLTQAGGQLAKYTSEEINFNLAPYQEKDIPALLALLERGDEAARRMGQYISHDELNRTLYTQAMYTELQGKPSTEALIRQIMENCPTNDPVNRALYLDSQTLLPDQVLPFVDRLSMAHALEVRPPFLDPDLVAFAWRIPGKIKIKQGRVKHILKDAVEDLLPPGIVQRPKEGFLMPINNWLIRHLKDFIDETLSLERLKKHGMLSSEAVQTLLLAHNQEPTRYGNRIWNLMMFQLWYERYIH
ncbi:asparagine synthase (glutamine-hydrolyzing) [Magnetococcales bacterium HHB-1]